MARWQRCKSHASGTRRRAVSCMTDSVVRLSSAERTAWMNGSYCSHRDTTSSFHYYCSLYKLRCGSFPPWTWRTWTIPPDIPPGRKHLTCTNLASHSPKTQQSTDVNPLETEEWGTRPPKFELVGTPIALSLSELEWWFRICLSIHFFNGVQNKLWLTSPSAEIMNRIHQKRDPLAVRPVFRPWV